MIDLKETEVEIRVTRDPNGGFRVWVNTDHCVLRAYRIPKLHLEGLTLTEQVAACEETR